ncbi:DegV family protein [Hutsoniella sourekii]|uniref:DegV family protein n=1 Tax=Hutsoniella sourekii TaxID=87650 RepID=UPI000486436F|nr:DegV family protein [Hutsoniella sourekii]
MKEIIIVTESGADLDQKWISQYGIRVVPMHVQMNQQTYDDAVNVSAQDIVNHYQKTGQLAKTAGSTPQDFTKMFMEISLNNPEAEIVYIGYSKATTVSYNSCRLVSEDFPKVHLVDSKNVTLGLSNIILAACQYLEDNPKLSAQDLVNYIEKIRENVLTPKS